LARPLAAPLQSIQLGVIVHRNGLELPENLTPEQWHGVGEMLAKATAGVQFMWGDFLAYTDKFRTTKTRGNGTPILADGVYETWAAVSGFDPNTLRDAKYVCQSVPISRRRDMVSFSHLREIVGCVSDTQIDYWQDRVVREKLSRKDLRFALKTANAKYHDAPVTPVKTFLLDAQLFVAAYRNRSASWAPAFKAEVAKMLAPVVEDLMCSDPNTALRFLAVCGRSFDSLAPTERCEVRRRISELTQRLGG